MTPARIDVHSHYIGGSLAHLMEKAPPMPGSFKPGKWSVDGALAFMDRHEIASQLLSVPFVFSQPTGGREASEFVRQVNDELAAVVAAHPTRFGAFATLPMSSPEAALAEMARALDGLGLDGVVLTTNADGHYFGQEFFEPILAELSRRKVPTFVHPTDCPGITALGLGRPSSVIEYAIDTARTITNALYSGVFRRYPDLNLILAHAGGVLPALAWRLSVHLDVGRGPSDDHGVDRDHIAEVLGRLHYETAIASSPQSLLPLLGVTTPDHVLFGSDCPAAPEYAVTEMIAHLEAFSGFTADELAGVEQGTARRLPPPGLTRRHMSASWRATPLRSAGGPTTSCAGWPGRRP